ncbi:MULTISPECIES: hypothetical protein [unclassified Polaribacter]|jgi:hypothetical protein|uniref:hypothetical protein n=1 Tax=unclassified Polaribacter TaxID=196858 RepID=UPI00052B87D5|nr:MULTISPECIES: hypothetical protein [unclassified Polaribacter]KGL59266.1 hypothetical protein PHEL49_0119 [Polaribacter sp. Hel1_33_49]PKV63747.1 hypothetical protein ATE90_0113 [Polaribacter sp. Hel1_33_96]
MHKKLESDLMSLAHSILKMKNKKDVFALKQKSKEIYEKLSMLAFVEEYVNTTPNLKESKEELIEKVAQGFVSKDISIFEEATSNEVVEDGEKIVYDLADTPKEESEMEEILEQPFDELEEIKFSENETEHINEVIKIEVNKTKSLEEELQDIISVDVMADLFENAQPKSLNDKLVNNIQIGLNDRIIFVKNLFNNQQEDYNRVISQLNTFKSEKEAKQFINKMIKPDYNWSEHEELEKRFLEIIERKFA